jgi:hypothetical protein
MMHLYKSFLLLFSTVLLTNAAHAQDEIYKIGGGIIDAKVILVGVNSVTFKRYDDMQGPDHTLQKRSISKIVYENGTIDVFAEDGGHRRPPVPGFHDPEKDTHNHPGRNIISLIPAYTASPGDNTINDAGIGIGYERALDTWGHLSFDIRGSVFFSSSQDFSDYSYGGNAVHFGNYVSYYLMPGLKFYPMGDSKKVRYSLSASFFYIFGGEPYAVYAGSYYWPTPTPPSENYNYSMYGVMITNSINVTATKHAFLAVDLSLAAPISDKRHIGDDITALPDPIIQFGIRIGYRY